MITCFPYCLYYYFYFFTFLVSLCPEALVMSLDISKKFYLFCLLLKSKGPTHHSLLLLFFSVEIFPYYYYFSFSSIHGNSRLLLIKVAKISYHVFFYLTVTLSSGTLPQFFIFAVYLSYSTRRRNS